MRVEINAANQLDLTDIIRRSPVADKPDAEMKLRNFLRASIMSWTGSIDGEIICVWGLIAPTILSDRAYLWLLTTDTLEKHPFVFVRHSQMIVNDMLKNFSTIEGHVVEGNRSGIRWLKWLGFKMGQKSDGLISFRRTA